MARDVCASDEKLKWDEERLAFIAMAIKHKAIFLPFSCMGLDDSIPRLGAADVT
jgi:hypothetical protein